jgi:hypothetical protein
MFFLMESTTHGTTIDPTTHGIYHSCQKKPNLHMNSLNKLLHNLSIFCIFFIYAQYTTIT